MMNFELEQIGMVGAAREKCDVLVLLVPKNFKAAKDELSQWVAQAMKSGDLEPSPGKVLPMYKPSQAQATRLVLASTGEGTFQEVRKAMVAALGASKSSGMKKLTVCFASPAKEEAIRSAVLAVADATYVYNTTQSKPPSRSLQRVRFLASNAARLNAVFDRAVATVSGVELAKEWANRPANFATPSLLAKAAQALAQHPKITCEVFGPKEVEKLAMGAFLAVAQGSDEPLRFIVLRYTGAAKTQAPTVVIGKGITFDSGGISIKPACAMVMDGNDGIVARFGQGPDRIVRPFLHFWVRTLNSIQFDMALKFPRIDRRNRTAAHTDPVVVAT
jgi:leucyl aminopeptidase